MPTPSTSAGSRRGIVLLFLGVFTACLIVYLFTMAPGLFGLDSAELAAGAHTLGIVHSPGSPLYMLAGHVFMRLPFRDRSYGLNLFSGVCSALCVSCLFLSLFRITGRPWLSALASGALAFSYYFWAWALVAELYAPHVCFASVLILLLVLWSENRRRLVLFLMAFLFGIGMGNHLSLVLLLPGVAWVFLARGFKPWREPATALLACGAGLLGLSVYLYLPWRHACHPPMDYVRDYFPGVNLATPSGLWWMVSGRMFEPLFFSVPPARWPEEVWTFVRNSVSNFHVVGMSLGLLGLFAGFRRHRSLTVGLVIMYAGSAVFFLSYGAIDKAWMFGVTHLIWSIWLGIGAHALARSLERNKHAFLKGLPCLLLAAHVSGGLIFNWRKVDVSEDRSARHTGEALMRAMALDGWFFGLWEDAPILEYLQLVEQKRPDITIRNLVFLGPERGRAAARAALNDGRPVYTSAKHLLAEEGLFFGSCHIGVDNVKLYRVGLAEVRKPPGARSEGDSSSENSEE